MENDLIGMRVALKEGSTTAARQMALSAAAAGAGASRHAFVSTCIEGATAVAAASDLLRAAGGAVGPLAGLAVSIKDLFDVEGQVTAAGSLLLAEDPAAAADCPAVARLRQAGAAIIGRTNMTEFAFSAIGINPHFGTPANPATLDLDPTSRIPGGSTSGGAVSVATGAAWAALGSDTGGSIRIPAALQGLVGFKSTARLTPTAGAVPLSTTLDTVCAITRSVRDAVLLHALLAARQPRVRGLPIDRLRLGVPTNLMLDRLEPVVAQAFERSLASLRAAGARVETITLPLLDEVAGINIGGGFSPVEAWAWHRNRMQAAESRYDARVASRIRRGERMSAADYIDLIRARHDWIGRMEAALAGFDAMLSPTVPCAPPPLAPLVADDEAFFAANALLLRNPSVVNLLDGCALSLPCHAPGEMPVGLMVWGAALRDDEILDVATSLEAVLGREWAVGRFGTAGRR